MGYLLDLVGHPECSGALADHVRKAAVETVPLSAHTLAGGERDEGWKLAVNVDVEPDLFTTGSGSLTEGEEMALELHLRLDAPEFADLRLAGEPIALAIRVASQGAADDPSTIEAAIVEALPPVERQRALGVARWEYRQLAKQASTNWEQVAKQAQKEREAMDAMDMDTPRLIGPNDEAYPLLLARVQLPADER